MTDLQAPDLDDRRFQDLVDETKRLIPRYCPEWTNHNVSDPGVTLIELFSWMTEMTIYRLNQVPERFYTKFLELVGIDLFPPSIARTEVTFWLSAPIDDIVEVPAGTEVTTVTETSDEAIVFSTLEPLEIRQPVLTGALTAAGADREQYHDIWDDLRFDTRVVTCFESSPLVTGDALYLGFEDSLAGNVLVLDFEADVEGIGVDPTHPPLAWQVWTGQTWADCTVVDDTTGGLNRNGRLRLIVPMAHEPLSLGNQRGFWLRALLLDALPGQAAYQQSPQIRSVVASSIGGTAPAEHSQIRPGEELGRSNAMPDQRFALGHAPVLELREHEYLEVVTQTTATRWRRVHDFSASGPDDLHYVLDEVDGVVRFGPRIRYPDGSIRQHGAIPLDGASIRISGYRTGGGATGNVGTNTLVGLRTTLPYIARVGNRLAATGGVDAETVQNAKLRGPMTLRTGYRAVTAGDYERLAREATGEVARSRALPPVEPGGAVRLLVVPSLRDTGAQRQLDDFALSDELVRTVSDHLDERRVLGTSLEIGTPYYQGVTVAALLRSVPGSVPTVVKERAIGVLNRMIDPLTGGHDGNGWPFDVDLNAVVITELLEAVDGVARVDDVLLFEFDLRTGVRHGEARQLIRLDDRSLFLSANHQVVVK